MRPSSRSARFAIALGAALLAAAPLRAQSPPDTGRLVTRIVARDDTIQAYALFLPPGYDPSRRRPVMFLMDPRGRALVPLQLFRPAAARHGWILISSYNTASDAPTDPNQPALNAMLSEAQRDLALDTRRFYLAGFSGTARAAWMFAYPLTGHVAGIVGAGGGWPNDPAWRLAHRGRSPFAFFGTAGVADFNYEEMRALDATLDSIGAAHHLELFDGGHAWPPTVVASAAIEWLELQAMRGGLRAIDRPWVDSLFAARRAQADSLAAARLDLAAHTRYRQLAADFAGLHDVADATRRATELEASEPVRRARAEQSRLAARDTTYTRQVVDFLRAARASRDPVPHDRSMKQLRIDALRREASNAADSLGAPAAQRMLEQAFVFLSFYEPRAYIERNEPARALALLRLADAIHPDTPTVCLHRARARALLGQRKEAIGDLRCLADARTLTSAILADPLFNALRDEPSFKELEGRVGSR